MTEQREGDRPRPPAVEDDGRPPSGVGEGTDVEVDRDSLRRGVTEPETPTSDATAYEEGDAQGGTGGLDAGGAG
jgi:hypothetical protein